MTTAQTFDAARLQALSDELSALRDLLTESPEWCEDTPAGKLAELDDDILALARSVVFRLHMDRKYPAIRKGYEYLPDPSPAEPAPAVLGSRLRVWTAENGSGKWELLGRFTAAREDAVTYTDDAGARHTVPADVVVVSQHEPAGDAA